MKSAALLILSLALAPSLDAEVRAAALKRLRERAANVFGGYTLSNAAGGWRDDNGQLIEEGAIRLDIYTEEPYVRAKEFATEAKSLFNQTSVLLDYAGRASYIN